MTRSLSLIFCLLFVFFHSSHAKAQATEEEAYDPFSDYSEFDESSDEEADVHFFRNGRFLTVGILGGFKGFTDNLSTIYSSAPTYGLFLSYFYDLRLAIQFGLKTGDFPYSFSTASGQTSGGSVSFSLLQVDMKYFINTQNVTKGVAELNPYIIGGFSQISRTYTVVSSVTSTVSNAKESSFGLDVGAGVEIPISKKKAYYGFQFMFHFVNFSDSNSKVWLNDYNTTATLVPTGQQYDILAVLGLNF